MKTMSLLSTFLMTTGIMFMVFSCEKTALNVENAPTERIDENLFPVLSEEIINGELVVMEFLKKK